MDAKAAASEVRKLYHKAYRPQTRKSSRRTSDESLPVDTVESGTMRGPGRDRYAHPCSDRRRCLRVRRRRAHNTAERSRKTARETRHHAGAVPATGMAVRRGSVRTP